MELYAVQKLNYLVGDFLYQVLYCLAQGYEAATRASRATG
jgi:hypothetical protein